jgi:MFS transporter, Spinster family, sphingosine-1-phosphate transporter
MVLGLPGVAMAALAFLTLKEPRLARRTSDRACGKGAAALTLTGQPTLKETCMALWGTRSFRHLLFSYALQFFFISGILQWQPTFFLRSHGFKTGELGTWLALVFGAGGLLGTYWGGALASRYATHNERIQLRTMALLYAVLAVISIMTYVSSSRYLAFVALAAFSIGMNSSTGPLWATIQTIVPERMRATAIALIFLVANLVGTGFGPLAVGALSDALAPWAGNDSLRYALIIASPGLFWAAWYLWRGSVTVARDIDMVQRAQQTGTSELWESAATPRRCV